MSSPSRAGDAPGRRRALTALLPWGVAALLFLFLGRWLASSWDQLRSAELVFSLPWLVASFLLLGAYLTGRALVWHYLTLLVGADIPLGRAMGAWFYSQLGKYLPGKIFLYLGRLYFYAREGRGAGPVSLAFGVELVASFSASLFVVLSAALALGSTGFGPYRAGAVGALLLLLGALHPAVLRRVVLLVARVLRRRPFPVEVGYGPMLRFVALYFLNWLVCGAALFAFLRSFHPLDPWAVLFLAAAFSFASMVGMVVVLVPAGLGVREGILALFLATLMPEGVAVASALAARVWFSLTELAGVGVAYLASGALPRPDREELERLRALEAGP